MVRRVSVEHILMGSNPIFPSKVVPKLQNRDLR